MFSLEKIRNIFIASLFAGLCAGLMLSILQSIQVIPIILEAEAYEQQANEVISEQPDYINASQVEPSESDAWQPRDGWERIFFTVISNICLAVGFALLLGAVSHLRDGISSWRNGLLWGLAGYIAFFVSPSLGLPPELPGTEAANLNDRQLWWLMAVFDTAAGLWLLFFAKNKANKILGVILLMAPHFLGAPQPANHSSSAPIELADRFIVATAFANAIFWLTLGAFMGLFSDQGQIAK